MISFKSFAVLVLQISCFSFFFTNPSSVSAYSSTVADIQLACKESITNYYDLCVESLQSDPRHLKTTPNELAKLSMKICLDNATAIRSDMQKLLVKNKSSHHSAMLSRISLRLCIKRYNAVVDDIRSGIPYFKLPMPPAGSPINDLLYYASLNVTNCEEHLKKHGVQPALIPRSQILSHLIDVANDLIILTEI